MVHPAEQRGPRLRDIGLALLSALVALIALLQLGDVVKAAGALLYWLPARLGLVQQAQAADVWRHDLQTLPEGLQFSAAGRYMVYTADYDLLVISATLRDAQDRTWLVLTEASTGRRADAQWVERGMRMYDSHLAPGRPVFSVEIPRPGTYRMEAPHRPAEIAIVRDYVTGNEARISFIFAAELALLASPLAVLYGRPYLRQWLSSRAAQRARREEVDAAFKLVRERRRGRQDDPDAPYRPKF